MERLALRATPDIAETFVLFREDGTVYGMSHGAGALVQADDFQREIKAALGATVERGGGRTIVLLRTVEASIDEIHGEDGRIFVVRVRPLPEDERLSPTQRQIALRIIEGSGTSAIATELGISRETVRSHVRTIYRRLEIASRVELLERFGRRRD